mgnify:CR=1 FL=1
MKNPIILIILSLILPPLAVFFKAGAGKSLIINIILCFLFFIPAVIHSLIVCFKK